MSVVALVRRAGLGVGRAMVATKQPARTRTGTPIAVGIPARTKLPVPQRIVLAAMMFTGIWFTPVWVLVHIRDYNGTRKAE